MHVGDKNTAKKEVIQLEKIQNIQHYENKNMAAKSVPFSYC